MTEILALLVLAVIGGQFWLQRQYTEHAGNVARHYCHQNQLQFISIARSRTRLAWLPGRGPGWINNYTVEFSSNGENRLSGTIRLFNQRLMAIEFPPYPLP